MTLLAGYGENVVAGIERRAVPFTYFYDEPLGVLAGEEMQSPRSIPQCAAFPIWAFEKV